MDEKVNKILLAGDKIMPQMHMRHSEFIYNVCGPFTRNKEIIQKLKETGDSRHIYQIEPDKACFQRGMAYGDFKDLSKRTAVSKALGDTAVNIIKNLRYDGC